MSLCLIKFFINPCIYRSVVITTALYFILFFTFSFLYSLFCYALRTTFTFKFTSAKTYTHKFIYLFAFGKYCSNDEDTDSLEIKPPQMIGRYDKHKKSSGSVARNEKKHSRGEHRHKERARDRSDRHGGRQHHGTQSSGRHYTTGPTEPYSDKYHNSSSRDSSAHHKRYRTQFIRERFSKRFFFFF